MRLGAHVSTAGGVGNAPGNAEAIGAECMQIFTRNQNRWDSKPISPDEAERYRREVARTDAGPVLAHDSYLINLATEDAEKLSKSTAAFVDELARAALLGLDGLVMHPGSHLGAGVDAGVRRFAASLDRCLEEAGDGAVDVLLETTAGQGTNLGSELAELRDIIAASRHEERRGVCLDSCHLFAAGQDLSTEGGYEALVQELDGTVGLDRVRAWHLNDSKKPLGSRRDRHAQIGDGEIGLEAFGRIVRDQRWAGLAACLETPGGPERWTVEIELLRGLRDGDGGAGPGRGTP